MDFTPKLARVNVIGLSSLQGCSAGTDLGFAILWMGELPDTKLFNPGVLGG